MTEQTVPFNTFSEPERTSLLYKILVVMGMMTLMGGTLTGVMTYLNIGYSNTFLTDWLHSFLTAALTVMPLGFGMMALLTKLAETLLPNSSEQRRNLIIGIAMACIMESGMAFATVMNNIGFADRALFLSSWLQGVIGALPVALTLMTITSMTIKPKIEQILKS